LQVIVPDVYGELAAWALPSTTAGSSGAFPSVGDQVWVSFEHGDTDYPVWQLDQGDQNPAQSGYVGKYRGVVVSNDDPMQEHRLEVTVADVDPWPAWATPSPDNYQYAETPDVGSEVWIDYENGDPSHPRWVGLA
ncbi:MAG: phage baseplate assembly protein V, partial [Ilumatobacteraceae bacterium]